MYVAYHVFDVEDIEDIEDIEDANVDEEPFSGWYPSERLTVRQGIVYIVSPGHTHLTTVTMQAWAHEPPPPPPGDWEISGETEFVCRSGTVTLVDFMRETMGTPLDLGGGPMVYRIRAHSRGHDRMRNVEAGDFDVDDEEALRHIEQYLLQFWPTAPIPPHLPPPLRM